MVVENNMESSRKTNNIEPSIIAFDVFGTLVKIGERRFPYRNLIKSLKQSGRKLKPDAKLIMSHNLDFTEL